MRELWRRIQASYKAIKYSYRICKVLLLGQKYFASVRDGVYKDSAGNYLPWYTFPAIEALKNWDLSSKRVFEYSSGHSTLFWASRAKQVVSVEHNPVWFENISKLVPQNAQVILSPITPKEGETDPTLETREQLERYAESIRDFGIFDIIVIDGYEGFFLRHECARVALSQLSANGLMIVDNSDWMPVTTRFLRDSGLIEVDFSGPKAGRDSCQTTSFFFARQFDFEPAGDQQPLAPIGGRIYEWEAGLESAKTRGNP
ncbi:MAG TPA: SAM-dependent methyltransferase [Blastocatellia bacterium]|nr:SAM-dependent methyltransferase [Blastocatellia bacterium]